MSLLLQKTKLFIPTARARLVDRPRVMAVLDGLRADGARLAVISAPAGSGKSTGVTQWLNRLDWPVGWLALDSRDNTPARFFGYLIGALQTVLPGVGREAGALLDLPGTNLEEVVLLLTNDLVDAPGPFILALDDYHTITNPAIHQAVNLLVEAQPPQMRLILLTREDPPLQLSRRRALGQLVELRQNDLRFTLNETVEFLNQGMGLTLTIDQVQRLEGRTEGWIAGLQMAALSLQQAGDPETFIRDFSGSHRFILDYLIEEVLRRQPDEVQAFLLQTSILDRMCAALCAAVTGKTAAEAQTLLDGLGRANLFVFSLDDERRWYRYHHLFGDLLRMRLQADPAIPVDPLNRRASDWFEANGDPRLAVTYALKANDPGQAADLIEKHIAERWQTVDLEFFLLVNQLPVEIVNARPGLCMHSAWACVITGQIERVLPLVEAAERALSAPGRSPTPADGANWAFARTLRAYLTDLSNQPVKLDESLEVAYSAIPESSPGMRNSVAVIIGTIYFMEGDFAAARRYFLDALERDRRIDGTNAIPIAVMRLVYVLRAEGRFDEAADLLRTHIAYVRQRGSRRFYIAGALNLLWGEILLDRGSLADAEAAIREGLHLLDDWPSPPIRAVGYSLLARVEIARGQLDAAREAVAQAESLRERSQFHAIFNEVVDRARVLLWTAGQDRAALERWAAETNHTLADRPFSFRYEARRILLGRAWLASGNLAQADDLLARLLAETSATDRCSREGRRLEILVLRAAVRASKPIQAMTETERAELTAIVDEALRLAARQGRLRVFVDAGEPLRRALNVWLACIEEAADKLSGSAEGGDDWDQMAAFARRVTAAYSLPAADPLPGPTGDLPEPLSGREREVLVLAAQGLTNGQIAEKLVISVRTVKKHIENIHGKLGVQNRTQAAARARELGLL